MKFCTLPGGSPAVRDNRKAVFGAGVGGPNSGKASGLRALPATGPAKG